MCEGTSPIQGDGAQVSTAHAHARKVTVAVRMRIISVRPLKTPTGGISLFSPSKGDLMMRRMPVGSFWDQSFFS